MAGKSRDQNDLLLALDDISFLLNMHVFDHFYARFLKSQNYLKDSLLLVKRVRKDLENIKYLKLAAIFLSLLSVLYVARQFFARRLVTVLLYSLMAHDAFVVSLNCYLAEYYFQHMYRTGKTIETVQSVVNTVTETLKFFMCATSSLSSSGSAPSSPSSPSSKVLLIELTFHDWLWLLMENTLLKKLLLHILSMQQAAEAQSAASKRSEGSPAARSSPAGNPSAQAVQER